MEGSTTRMVTNTSFGPIKTLRIDSLDVHHKLGPIIWGKGEFISWYFGLQFRKDFQLVIQVAHA